MMRFDRVAGSEVLESEPATSAQPVRLRCAARRPWRMGLAGLALLLAACGGESDDEEDGDPNGDASGEVDTGLPEERPLQDVTVEEYQNACESLREDVGARLGPEEATRGVCEVYSGAFTDDPGQCESAATSCVSQVNGGTHPLGITRADLDFTTFECGDVGELQGCSVTVGELETCLEDRMSAIEALLAENGCDNAASVNLATAMGLLSAMSPASCARVDEECPGVGPSFTGP